MDLMGGQIVHDDDVVWPQLGNERLFDIGEKGLAVHRAVEDHGRSNAVVTQRGGEVAAFQLADEARRRGIARHSHLKALHRSVFAEGR